MTAIISITTIVITTTTTTTTSFSCWLSAFHFSYSWWRQTWPKVATSARRCSPTPDSWIASDGRSRRWTSAWAVATTQATWPLSMRRNFSTGSSSHSLIQPVIHFSSGSPVAQAAVVSLPSSARLGPFGCSRMAASRITSCTHGIDELICSLSSRQLAWASATNQMPLSMR